MVFCGEHSKGCHRCRKKKTRCDAKPSGCTQCARVNVICPGYRNQGDLIFKDSTTNVIRKAKAKQAKAKAKAEVTAQKPLSLESLTSDSLAPVEPFTSVANVDIVPNEDETILNEAIETVIKEQDPFALTAHSWLISLAPSFEDRAIGFFISNHVIGINGPTRGHFDYITEMPAACSTDEALLASMKAVGFAGYSHTAKAPQLFKYALQSYNKALRLTNAALACPTAAKKDTTLMSVLILSMFETVTGINEKSLTAWSQHINGAATLVKLRGREQLHTAIGRRLLGQVNALLILNCLQHEKPMPDHIVEMMEETQKIIWPKEPAWHIYRNMVTLATFSWNMHKAQSPDLQDILDKALQIDQDFINIIEPPPTDWEYQTYHTDARFECIFNGTYHVYFDYWIAQIWNTVRCARIILHNIIREVLLRGFSAKPPKFITPQYTTQFQTSTDLLYVLQADILSTVPQHLGLVSRSNPNVKASTSSQLKLASDFSITDSMTRFSGGYFLIWPLWFMGIMSISTEEVRQLVIANLRTVKREMGIKLASVLADAVESKSQIFRAEE